MKTTKHSDTETETEITTHATEHRTLKLPEPPPAPPAPPAKHSPTSAPRAAVNGGKFPGAPVPQGTPQP